MARLRLVRSTASEISVDETDRFAASGFRTRQICPGDHAELGGVLFRAYLGGPEEEEATVEEGVVEVLRTVTGDYGPFMAGQSFVAVDLDDRPVGASLLTLLEGKPLVAHAIVEPRARGFGVGSRLLAASSDALQILGEPYAHLAVSAKNAAAARLYLRLGFIPWVPGSVDAWKTAEDIGVVASNVLATMPDFVEPLEYGVGYQLNGLEVTPFWTSPNKFGLPAFLLAFLTGYRDGEATIDMSARELDAAIRMLAPAEACDVYGHLELAAWRALREMLNNPALNQARVFAKFVGV